MDHGSRIKDHASSIKAQGPRAGHATAAASLVEATGEEGVSQAWLEEGNFEVQVAGQMYALTVQLQPFYDGSGEKMRS